VLTVLIVFIVVSAVEVVVIDLIVHPWPWVRVPLFILGLWGLAWMLGLLCGYVTRPHCVGPDGILARMGPAIQADLPWDAVESVSPARDIAVKAARVRDEKCGRTLALRMQDETNVLVELERPVAVRLGDAIEHVDAVRFWVDDLDGFLSAVRAHIP
jgi:hypothetical protein